MNDAAQKRATPNCPLHTPLVRVASISDVSFDDSGFWSTTDRETTIEWRNVIKVAWGYEIHPIAIADWDFWAFQTPDPEITYWVYTDFSSPFSSHVITRFRIVSPPPMNQWNDDDRSIRTYVVWPEESIAQSMYTNVKEHWWSWSRKLAYSQSMIAPNAT
mgnify:CR=1 FL=1|jgi:hypothetical protein